MFDELSLYNHNGHFHFKKGLKLSEVCNAPEEPGVYLIYQLQKGKVQLVYVGASGTITQRGMFKNQLLRGRINNKQAGVQRQQYFEQEMEQNNIDALDIYWYVTFDDKITHLPSYVESVLLQKYFEFYGILPKWNNEF